MENTKYGKRREGRWTPIRAKAHDTKANPNSWETHLVRKRWDIGLLRALRPGIMMMMMTHTQSPTHHLKPWLVHAAIHVCALCKLCIAMVGLCFGNEPFE